MATDLGQAHNPQPVKGLVSFIDIMTKLGIGWKDINQMCTTNPHRLLF